MASGAETVRVGAAEHRQTRGWAFGGRGAAPHLPGWLSRLQYFLERGERLSPWPSLGAGSRGERGTWRAWQADLQTVPEELGATECVERALSCPSPRSLARVGDGGAQQWPCPSLKVPNTPPALEPGVIQTEPAWAPV